MAREVVRKQRLGAGLAVRLEVADSKAGSGGCTCCATQEGWMLDDIALTGVTARVGNARMETGRKRARRKVGSERS
jgi:hypothetical protein